MTKWAQLLIALGKIASALWVKNPAAQQQAQAYGTAADVAVELVKETAKPETQQPPKVAE
jgi:hypothetical protein